MSSNVAGTVPVPVGLTSHRLPSIQDLAQDVHSNAKMESSVVAALTQNTDSSGLSMLSAAAAQQSASFGSAPVASHAHAPLASSLHASSSNITTSSRTAGTKSSSTHFALPRLPSISSLLAGIEAQQSSNEFPSVRRASVPSINDERPSSATSQIKREPLETTSSGSATRSGGASGKDHPSSSRHEWDDPSPFSHSLPASPLVASAPLFPRAPLNSSRLPLTSTSSASVPEPLITSRNYYTGSPSPPDTSPRLSTRQLISPTGGPLHPLPSGLVGFAPLSPSQVDKTPAAFRPRSNSLSMHPYANPLQHYRSSTQEYDPRRRGSLTDGIARPSSSSGWSPTISSEANFSHHAATAAARARKQAMEAANGGWNLGQRSSSSYPPGDRPRTSSSAAVDEGGAPGSFWADHERDLAFRQARTATGRVNSLASSASSPLAGPEGGNDARFESDSIDPYEASRSRHMAARETVGSVLNNTTSAEHRYSDPMTRPNGGRLSLGGALDVGNLHITNDPTRRIMPSGAHALPSSTTSHVNLINPFTGGPATTPFGQPNHPSLPPPSSPSHPQNAFGSRPEPQPWARTSPTLPGTGSFPSQPPIPLGGAVDDGSGEGGESGRYGCPHCTKRFARPSSLRTHIHSHTGEKPFSCDTCGRGFSVQSNLRRHLKIHRGSGLAQTSIGEQGRIGQADKIDRRDGSGSGGDSDEVDDDQDMEGGMAS